MSVVIQNMGETSQKGVYRYEVRINRDTICECVHLRKEGLAELLRTAAEQVDATPDEWKEGRG